MFAGRGLTRARDVLGGRGVVGDSIGLHLGRGAGWGTLTIYRGKNLIGDLRDDGVAERLQSGASVWDSSGDPWDMVWFGVEMSVHPSG